MKTKLTLTVRKSIIINAKRYSRRTGKSISQLFEELFEKTETSILKSTSQRAAERLIDHLASSKPTKTMTHDKQLIKNHVARKYA
jgi:hypothetical protein